MSTLRIRQAFRRWSPGDSGQDLLEYALLASLIAIAVIGAVDTVGGTIKTIFWDVIANAKF
ncbi:MAG TPA: Flp family type IVb pilin [Vicinamibacterales bacterium]|jgi:Flp pilus assembly pilin Flp|nr:Flp family type IVb pilin [Vicinamibacterales bacterium]